MTECDRAGQLAGSSEHVQNVIKEAEEPGAPYHAAMGPSTLHQPHGGKEAERSTAWCALKWT